MKLSGHVLQLIFIPTLFGRQIFYGDGRDVVSAKRLRLNSKMASFANNHDDIDNKHASLLSPKSIGAPWLVSLRQKFNNKHFCSGSLISHYFIITVAQCIADDHQLPSNVMVIVGTENLFIGGYKYDINDVFIHPEYRQECRGHERDNNLALFRTTTPIVFSSKVYPIELESDCTSDYVELVMFAFSFVPLSQEKRHSWRMGVQETHLLTLEQEMCALHQAHTLSEYLTLKTSSRRQLCTYFTSMPHFCIDTPGNGIVSSDISVKNTPRLVAISTKTNSCYIRYPTANTRIAAHIGWISKIMRINEPQIVNMMHSGKTSHASSVGVQKIS